MRRLLAALLLLCAPWAAPALADARADALRDAFGLMAQGDYPAGVAVAEAAGRLSGDIALWRALRESRDGDFRAHAAFLAARPDWPGLDRLRASAERLIPEDAAPADVLALMDGRPPLTYAGARALVRALRASGRDADATAVLGDAWLALPPDAEGERLLLADFGADLAPFHAGRADRLLWAGEAEGARRMLPLLDGTDRALAEARLAAGAGRPLGDLPPALAEDPRIAFARFARAVAQGEMSDAAAILAGRTAEALGDPRPWAQGRARVARWLIREGRGAEAYAAAAGHGLSDGEALVDLEWVAGHAALSELRDAATALAHFQRSEAAASGPISRARAAYWAGRAEEALGRPDDAALSFARAAQSQTTFYGLLAAERLGLSLDPTLTGQEPFGDWRGSAMVGGDLGQAMLLLLAAGDRDGATLFARKLAQTLDRDGVGQLAALLAELQEPHLSVLVGKEAAARGIVVPSAAFPLHPLAGRAWPVGADLALAIARRESEFNPLAASPVGALGLMQIMPATAREIAGTLGVPYARGRLTEWEYNATLGTRYLAGLVETFGTSPVLVAAGYNAGPGRPRQWMAERGDPRSPDVDVVEWIERIPFDETRAYVMRVAESLPVYQARLTGRTGPVAFTALLRGEPPVLRPVARPGGSG